MASLRSFFYSIFRAGVYGEFPYRANIAVTKECHSRCQNCFIWQKKKSPNELSLDEFKLVARDYRFLKWISLTGGEPTDRDDLAEIVEAFHRVSSLYLVNLSTNGLNQKKIMSSVESLAEVKPSRLIVAVSIDGPAPVNDKIRGIQGSFARATSTLAELLEWEARENSNSRGAFRAKIFASMTLYEENAETLECLLADLSKLNRFSPDRFHLNIAHYSSHLYGNKGQGSKQFDSSPAIRALLKGKRFRFGFQEALERTYQSLAMQYMRTGASPVPCAALKSSFHLNEKGDVFPCTIWDKPLGNVRDHEYSITKILCSETSLDSQKAASQGRCPNCWSPCEAYQTIAAHPFRALAKALT